jgi:hypothetical protein
MLQELRQRLQLVCRQARDKGDAKRLATGGTQLSSVHAEDNTCIGHHQAVGLHRLCGYGSPDRGTDDCCEPFLELEIASAVHEMLQH